MSAARYEIVRQLACGGMAEVLLARRIVDEHAPELVVIKRVLPHLSQAEGFMRMFATEARIASQLQHPNIVAVVEVGEMDALPFIAMERLDGGDLLRLLQQCVLRRQQLGTHVAMAIVAGAARGLGYAHRARARDGRPLKIIHRDVSPHNIFVTRDGGVKLLDFGIAKSAAQAGNTSTGQVKGKISYMSPEQIRARPLTARSDLWSLGVVLWESVAGEKLFTRDNDAATLHAILHDPIPKLSRPDAPELDDVIAQILHRDPDRRIATAEEIATRLEQLLARAGQSALSRIIAQRVASLVPALNPELDAHRPAVARSPEVVTFAVGPAFSQSGADHRGPHRKLEVADAPIEPVATSSRDDEDPTLLEIAAPPPDPDFDADETLDRAPDRPLVGESTDTHTIPMSSPVAATGTGGRALAQSTSPVTKPAPYAVASRRATHIFTGSAPEAGPPGPTRLKVRDDLDDSLTSEIVQPPRSGGPSVVRPLVSTSTPRVMPKTLAPRTSGAKPLPPTIAEKPKTLAPPTHKPPPSVSPPSATRTESGLGPESRSIASKPTDDALRSARPATHPPPSRPTPSPVEIEEISVELDLDITRPSKSPAPEAARPISLAPSPTLAPSPAPVADRNLAATFGDMPPRTTVMSPRPEPSPSPPQRSPFDPSPFGASPFDAAPPPRTLPPPSLDAQRSTRDTLAAAEIPSTVTRPTQPVIKRGGPWIIVAAVGGLCLVAGLVVAGAYAVGGLRSSSVDPTDGTTSTSALRTAAPAPLAMPVPMPAPPVAPALPAPPVVPVVPPPPVVAVTPSPVVAVTPPPVVAVTPPAPPRAAPQVAPPEPTPAPAPAALTQPSTAAAQIAPHPVAPAPAAAPPAQAARVAPRVTPAPSTVIAVRQPSPTVAPRPATAAPRPATAPTAAPRSVPRTAPLPDPFATVSAPRPVARPVATTPTAVRPVATPTPPTPRRASPTVRGGGIFTDL